MPTIDPNILKNIANTAGKVGAVSTMVGGITGNKLLTKAGVTSGMIAAGASILSRLSNTGLLPGGAAAQSAASSATDGSAPTKDDWRVRVSVGPSSNIFYKSDKPGILAPLAATSGVVFPYTPSITLSYQNNYQPMQVTHSINTVQAYQNSDVSSISIVGDFTAQTPEEANYVLAVVHFFKSASKMFFGDADDINNVGAPPPLLFLSGFGQHYFPNVSVILQSFVHTMTDDVDFIYAGYDERTRVPTRSSVQITLVPQYSRTKLTKFNLDAFARGDLINNKGNFL